MWYTIFALVCLVIIILWNPVYEHMTNADIKKKHDFHASKPKKWEIPNPEDTKEKLKARSGKGNQIYGPKTPPEDPNAPKPTSNTDTNGKMTYPDIYGPELLTASGSSKKTGESLVQHINDITQDQNYEFVPASEFPAGPSEPAPYLNDFSKILNM
jgi:hypothetical protein